MNAPNPARQVALVGKSCGGCDVSQAVAALAQQLKRALQAQMHDIAVRSHTDRSGKHAREVKRAAAGNFRQRANLDGLIQMCNDVALETVEHVLA